MITKIITIYHKDYDPITRLTKWVRYNYEVIFTGGQGSSTNKGYSDANDCQIRINYNINDNLSINNFAIGDIIVNDNISLNINTQSDLKNYEIYNITAKVNNIRCSNNMKHIHLSGK